MQRRARLQWIIFGLSLTLITDLDGVIREVSENAHSFLGVSARSAVGRNLLLFFAEDTLAVLTSIRRLRQLERVEGSARLKPRDRRPFPCGSASWRPAPGA